MVISLSSFRIGNVEQGQGYYKSSMEGQLDWKLFPTTTPSHWMFYTHQFQLSIFKHITQNNLIVSKTVFYAHSKQTMLNYILCCIDGFRLSCIMGNLGQFAKKQSCKIYSQSDFTFGDETHKKVKRILWRFVDFLKSPSSCLFSTRRTKYLLRKSLAQLLRDQNNGRFAA